jgi:hypothetical protein
MTFSSSHDLTVDVPYVHPLLQLDVTLALDVSSVQCIPELLQSRQFWLWPSTLLGAPSARSSPPPSLSLLL